MKRIGFCGASGTGKTTLAKRLADDGWLYVSIGIRNWIKRNGKRSVDELTVAERREMQWSVMCDKITFESWTRGFVADRTTLDFVAYAIMGKQLFDECTLCKYVDMAVGHAAKCYDVIFLLPSGVIEWQDDKVRFGKLWVELVIRGLAERAGIALVEIESVDLADRLYEVKMYLK